MKAILVILAALASAATLTAAELYSESFDTEAAAKVKIAAGANTATITSVDYSNFTIGSTVHSIPEAPSQIPGSAATRGFLMRQTYDGTARIINVLLADSFGGSPTFFSGSYRLKFDLFLGVAPTATTGTTEVGLFGIGNNDIGRAAYTLRSTSTAGSWGWLSTEGGIGTSGDSGLYDNNLLLQRRENNADAALFQSAFAVDTLPVAYTPGGRWTRVEVVCVAAEPPATSATVSVYFNGVKFTEGVSQTTTGFALFGYEDAFPGSNSSVPESQFALVDNVTVEEVGPYEIWIAQFFGAGANEAAPLADPDRDGFNNVLEYAFNLNPGVNQQPPPVNPLDAMANTAGMAPVIEFLPSPRSLRLSFVRRTGESGAGFFFDVATTPGAWQTLGVDEALIVLLGGGWEFVQFTVPASSIGPAANTSFFGRLKVTKY